MDLKDKIDVVLNLSKKVDFRDSMSLGANLFPILRLSFFIHLIRKDYVYKHSFKIRLYEFFKSISKYIINLKNSDQLPSKCDNLFLTFSTFKRNKINDNWFDLYVDSYIIKNKLKNFGIIEFPQRGIFKNPKTFPSKYLSPIIQFKARFHSFFYPAKIQNLNFKTLNLYLEKYDYSFSEKQLSKKISELNYYKKYFRSILKKHKVKKVYVTSFSMNYSMSIIWAANELGLETYELIHGSVYENSPYYTNWNLKTEYKLLPKYFLVWNDNQADYINKTVQKYPIGINDGNGFLEIFKNELISLEKYHNKWNKTLVKKHNKTILIILQREDIPDWLAQFIIRHSDFNWILRTHPGLNNDSYILKLPNISKVLSLTNVYCNEFKNFILFYILKKIDCLVAWKSTTIIEASLFDKKSIILTNHGIEYFQYYIDHKILMLGYEKKLFVSAFNKIVNEKL